LLSLGAAALLGVSSTADYRAGTSSSVLITPANVAGNGAVRAYLSANQTGVADITYTKVALNTASIDAGTWFDTTNNRWVPQSTRRIMIIANLLIQGTIAVGNSAALAIYKNGVLVANGVPSATSFIDQGRMTSNYMDTPNGTTDYYEIYGYVDVTAGTATFNSNQTNTVFNGFQI